MTTAPTPTGHDHTNTSSLAGAWGVLVLAGVFEVGYALSVAASQGFTHLTWSLVASIFFLLTLYCLSRALRTIDVGIGYAAWAGIGAVGAVSLGPVFFDETITATRTAWLAVIIGGVIWLKLSDRPATPSTRPKRRRRTPLKGAAPTLTAGSEVRWY